MKGSGHPLGCSSVGSQLSGAEGAVERMQRGAVLRGVIQGVLHYPVHVLTAKVTRGKVRRWSRCGRQA